MRIVSLKVDTVDEPTWRRLNRPIGNLELDVMLDGMRRFANDWSVAQRLLDEGRIVAVRRDGRTYLRTRR